MKKLYLGLLLAFLLSLVACNSITESQQKGSESPTKEVAQVTEEVSCDRITDFVQNERTEQPEITEVLEQEEVPDATEAPKPTETPKPTQAPESASVSPEISKLLENAEEYENTILRGTVCTDEQQANEYVREMSLSCSSFAVLVEDASYLHSAKEYLSLYPEIEKMTIDRIELYHNGICAVFTEVEAVYDANLCYAIRTQDVSVLTATEKEVYQYLTAVLEETEVAKLDRVEAVKVLHDYLVLHLKYDETYQSISHTPEGVVKNRTAVCDGYTRTMRLLLLLAGIENHIATGYAGNESHAWNLVRMEDGWYHVDVTWDDPTPDVEGRVRYLYFLKNDADMAKTHVWESEIACDGNAYEIYLYRDVLCTSDETLQEVYEKQIQTKEYLTFCYPKDGSLTQQRIMEYVMNKSQRGITYFQPEETSHYFVFEMVNPFWEN